MRSCLPVLALVLWVPGIASGEDRRVAGATTVVATAIPAATAMQIDGELSEAIWATVPVVSGFVQRDPTEGAPATFDTEVRVAFDETALYVAVNAIDREPSKIVGILARRDESSPSDWVRVYIDSFRDRRTAYEFSVNAAGVKGDTYWFSDGNMDAGWDAVWEVAVSRHDAGWRAEFRIPFSQLRFNPASAGTFGFAVMRASPRINETTTWPLLARSRNGFVSQFGDLTGLVFSRAPRRLELVPYAVAQASTMPVAPGNPLQSSPDPSIAAGLDLKYAVAPGLTLTATINPDFGQVEADPAVVNLSGFETFFAERRPFFVEGSGNFSFNLDCNDGQCTGLFYSRRIGRQPQRSVEAPENGFVASPDNSTILGAAKLTGRIGKFSVGVLDAVTSREDARLAGDFGRRDTPVEPATNFFLARASREFADQSRLSFMLTSTNRALHDDLRFLPSSAVTGGVDGDLRLGRRFNVSGFWAGSTVRGDADAISRIQRSTVHSFQRPDAGHIEFDPSRTSLGGHAGSLNVGKISGQRYRFSSNASYKSPGFDVNDLGFQSRADEISISNWHQLTWDRPGKYVRRKNINFNQWAGWNFDGDLRFSGGNINSHWTFTNNWTLGGGVNHNARGFNDRLTRGGPGGYVNPNWNGWSYLDTDNRKPVMANVSVNWFTDMHGSWNWNANTGLTWRPAANINARGSIGYSRNHAESQWVTGTTFGVLDQSTVNLSARINYTITPQLTVQLFAQPFVSAGDYAGFKELVDGRARDYARRYAPTAYDGNPDFKVLSFRTTNVLRWEYRPGSVLFAVWQQGRNGFESAGDFRFRNVGDVFEADATNVFLVKFSRWFNF
jgi:hypothetical protein